MKQSTIIDFVKKNKKVLLLFGISAVIFHQYIVMILVMALLAMLGIFTMKISRMVPHISAETVTASSILIGYVYGWQFGLGFGLICGTVGYLNASQMNMTTIIVTLVMGFVGVLGGLFQSLNYPFWVSFLIIYFIRANLTFFLMYVMQQSMVENVMHAYVESAYNMAVVIHFMNIFYAIIMFLKSISG